MWTNGDGMAAQTGRERQVFIKELHLAAFMKYNGATFTGFRSGRFLFLSDKTEAEWRVRHSNSCCRGVDNELITLRKFLKESKNV
jgi:hypothetical protein